MDKHTCLFAHQIDPVATDHIQKRKVCGLLLHTCGRTIVEKAIRAGRDPLEVELAWCAESQSGAAHGYKWGGPTYVLDVTGDLYQLCSEEIMTAHAGDGGNGDRADYLDGDWVARAKPNGLAFWRQQWPTFSSPSHLYASKSPNIDYVGVEMIPTVPGRGEPMFTGMLFTAAQHMACVKLAQDMATRYGWQPGWAKGPRLLGHEDVQLLQRQDAGGGWDPGWLRARPYFDMGWVRARV